MINTAGVIIIGGGVHGASLAFHLTQRGIKSIVLEKRFIAAEATGRSSGLVRMHYDLELETRLAWVSFQYFQNWAEMVGGDCGFTRTGYLKIVEQAYVERMRANVAVHQRIGIDSLIITADDVRRLSPCMTADDFDIAAYEPESGYADPSATAVSFMNAARQNGARLVQDCQVTGVRIENDKIAGVTTTQGDFVAPIVVNAAGAWAAEIGRMVGLELPVNVWRHDTMFIRRPSELEAPHPTVVDDINAMYFRPETGGLTLVGLEDGNPIEAMPADSAIRLAPDFVDRAVDRICQRIPLMERGSLHSAQGGYDGLTPDQRPILGQAGPEGFYLACGFSGTGFKISPAVGLCMTELIVDGRSQTVDIAPFSHQRFIEGKRLVGKHAYRAAWS
ncbi:MAG: FAD-binding oxidoreductase [Chloroflexi bacterium]|nr:FAD-binding oxidoreductase [Chloroflexota bacterium]